MRFNVRGLLLVTLIVAAPPVSWADLLTNGDFEGVAPNNTDEFLISSRLNAWQSNAYTRSPTAPSGFFAQAETGGNGGDYRLVQFINAGANGIVSGTKLELMFDYIYELDPLADTKVPRYAYLVGIASDRNYMMYQGAGPDGIDFSNPNTSVLAPDVLLASMQLTLNSGDWIRNQLLSATLSSNFYAIGVVFQTSCYGPPGGSTGAYCNYARGFDNVSLEKVPEPSSLALLGLALAGLGLVRPRRAH